MLKVKVKNIPVYHDGKQYKKDDELLISDEDLNSTIFEVIETVEETPFKGVKEATIRKALDDSGTEIPDGSDREALIGLMIENEISL